MFEIRTFHLASYFSWKAHESLNQNNEIQKSAMGLGVNLTYAHSMGSIYFAIRIVWNHLFMMSLTNFFSYMLPLFHQNLSHHLTNTPPCWSFKPAQSNQFKVDIKGATKLCFTHYSCVVIIFSIRVNLSLHFLLIILGD